MNVHLRQSLRRRVYEILDVGSSHDPASVIAHRLLVILILTSVASVVLESVPQAARAFGGLFNFIEVLALVVFSFEYLLRLWAAPEQHPRAVHRPWRARLVYLVQPSAVVDLLAIAPLYVMLFSPIDDLGVMLIFRLVRFFKLTRYSPGMRSLVEAVYAERRALAASLVILGGLMILAAALMHVAEAQSQPDQFGTIPKAMYWALITLTTVGYGDVVPITPLGKLLAGITAIFGLVMLALPIGILATAFAEVIHRRDFVVTWSMVARVPLFSTLDATEVSEIMRCLRSQTVEPGQTIARKDEPANSMYFVASGEVEILLPRGPVRLGVGHFFGEIAIIHKRRRTATVRAVSTSRLLVLDVVDFKNLMESKPDIARRVKEVAASRLAPEPFERTGDLAARELDEVEEPVDPTG